MRRFFLEKKWDLPTLEPTYVAFKPFVLPSHQPDPSGVPVNLIWSHCSGQKHFGSFTCEKKRYCNSRVSTKVKLRLKLFENAETQASTVA